MQIQIREQFGSLLNSLNLNGYGIEVGVAEGYFSKILLKTSNLKKLYLLDSWKHYAEETYIDSNNLSDEEQEKRYLELLKKMSSYENRVYPIRADCRNAVHIFKDNFFDFVYLDANHAYEFVKETLPQWYNKVKVGGLFAGHDYMNGIMDNGTIFGVKQAVDEFVEELKYPKLYSTTHDTPYIGNTNIPIAHNKRYFSWYFIK